MVRLTDLSESENFLTITDTTKRISSIPFQSIRTIELKSPFRLGLMGIIWNEMNVLLRNCMLAAIGCLLFLPFFGPINEWFWWIWVYGSVALLCFVALILSPKIGNTLVLICTNGNYTLEILSDQHWRKLYSCLKKHFPLLQNIENPLLYTPKPRHWLWSVLWTLAVLGVLSWSYENLSLAGTVFFFLFGGYSSYLFLRISFLNGRTEVSFEENQFVFLENRGRYKNHRHTIEFNRIDRLSMNANHMVTIHRRTQKELAAETGLENFNHYNRIDYHFLRKGYSLSPNSQGSLHRLQVEAINERVLQNGK